MYKYKIICDYQENFPSLSNQGCINDHQDKETFLTICEAINELGYECSIFGGVPQLIDSFQKKDVFSETIFLNLSDGMSQKYSRVQIPVLCEMLSIPYSGGGPFEVALTTNKHFTKLAVENIGINCPKGFLVTKEIFPDNLTIKSIKFPVIVKPNAAGSSAGISKKSICWDVDTLIEQLTVLLKIFSEVLIEEFIPGYDVTDFILGNAGNILLNEVLIAKHNNILIDGFDVMSMDDYLNRTNWYDDASNIISQEIVEYIKKASEKIVTSLNTYDIARLDYRVTEKGNVSFLEINTVPAIHPKSQVGAICNIRNIKFSDFLKLYIQGVTLRLTQ